MMRPTILAAALLGIATTTAHAQSPATHAGAAPTVDWKPAPAVFPAGAQMIVLQGDPGGNALFTVRLRFPDGYKLPAHTHPTDEHVTVISGMFEVGMGKKLDETRTMKLTAGGFVTAPANEAHYAIARGVTVVQVHAMGPFALTYVDPADTPRVAAGR